MSVLVGPQPAQIVRRRPCRRRRQLRRRRGRVPCADRPERRRQVDLLQHDQRPARARTAARSCSTARASPACRRATSGGCGVGRTFQIAATFGSMTVVENVQMALLSHAGEIFPLWVGGAHGHRERALELLAQVGMADAADRACQRARLWRRQARRACDRARQRSAPAADGRADRRHGAARTQRTDRADQAAGGRSGRSRCCSPSIRWTSCSPLPTASSCWRAAS